MRGLVPVKNICVKYNSLVSQFVQYMRTFDLSSLGQELIRSLVTGYIVITALQKLTAVCPLSIHSTA